MTLSIISKSAKNRDERTPSLDASHIRIFSLQYCNAFSLNSAWISATSLAPLSISTPLHEKNALSIEILRTVATVRKISIDKAFFSCNGVDIDRGASEVAEIHAEFKENALQYCNEKILMCDASKLGVRSSRFFADFDMIDRVITDSSADESFIAKLKASGVPVD